MPRLTIDPPVVLGSENGDDVDRSETAGHAGASESDQPSKSEGLDESTRTFIRWVGCWADG